eukprot:4408583-Prymnesium_polylepis.2
MGGPAPLQREELAFWRSSKRARTLGVALAHRTGPRPRLRCRWCRRGCRDSTASPATRCHLHTASTGGSRR